MKAATFIFLDFDGVICDSAQECFVSSRAAYGQICAGQGTTVRPDAPDEMRSLSARFMAMRPFVRNSEDYVFIQEFISRGIHAGSQAEFDALVLAAPAEHREEYSRRFYQVRADMLAADPGRWLELNPIYPHMKVPLKKYETNPGLFILSTKKPEYIGRIILHHGIDFDFGRILYGDEIRRKLDIASGVLDRDGGESAYFIDDQADHLKKNRDPRIITCLPLWGYIDKGCPQFDGDIRVIHEHDMTEIFKLLE